MGRVGTASRHSCIGYGRAPLAVLMNSPQVAAPGGVWRETHAAIGRAAIAIAAVRDQSRESSGISLTRLAFLSADANGRDRNHVPTRCLRWLFEQRPDPLIQHRTLTPLLVGIFVLREVPEIQSQRRQNKEVEQRRRQQAAQDHNRHGAFDLAAGLARAPRQGQ